MKVVESTAKFDGKKLVWSHPGQATNIPVAQNDALRLATDNNEEFMIAFTKKSPFPGGPSFNSENGVLLKVIPVSTTPGKYPFKCAPARDELPGLNEAGDEIEVLPSRIPSGQS